MWLLSCDGNLFDGKRIWLRPGTTHLLGRTHPDKSKGNERLQYIDHKSVSRKHLTIDVGTVKPGDITRLHARTEVTLNDSSKTGTTLNGETFKQETRTLTEKEYTIKLGSYESLFHLIWHPVVLSFASLSKKPGKDTLAPWKEKFEHTDVKLSLDYVTNETTHVVSKKRNTPASLQVLLQARWLVTDAFAEALATTLAKQSGSDASLLEDEFDGNWPSERNYLTPSGGEPNPRPDEYLKPNPARNELFQDFIFIFMSQAQYDNLFPVVAAGGGKAMVRDIGAQSITVEQFVEFVKEAAGRKKSSHFRLSQDTGKGGVVIVRPNIDGEFAPDFNRDLALALDQRSVDQREFLDAILTVDTSGLRKPLEEEPASSVAHANSQTSNLHSHTQRREDERQQRAVTVHDSPDPAEKEPPRTQQPTHEEDEPEQPPTTTKRRNRRIVTASRFKGFDDFDPSQFSKPISQSPEPSINNRGASVAPSDNDMDVDQPSQQASRTQQSSRKRLAPLEEEIEGQQDVLASILPGHAAMKRQKTLAGETGDKISFSKATQQVASEKAAKVKKKTKELDVKAKIQAQQARRQREDEERRKDEEAMRQGIETITFEEAKRLVKIEEMELLPDRQATTRDRGSNSDGRSERWDPAWNGRKNFKKFRSQGQRSDDALRLQRVIVALEEVPRKGHGIGEEYWINPSSKQGKKSNSQSQSQSQSTRQGALRSQTAAGADEDVTGFRRRSRRSQVEDDENEPLQDVGPDEIAGQPRDSESEAAAHANSAPSQTMRSETQRKASGKRSAAQQAADAPATKKARQGRAATRNQTINVDDDDDDALKFRRRKR